MEILHDESGALSSARVAGFALLAVGVLMMFLGKKEGEQLITMGASMIGAGQAKSAIVKGMQAKGRKRDDSN